MGHLVNPISYRLYNIRYWNNNWFLHNSLNYSYLLNQDIIINKFFKKLFYFYFNITKIGLIFVNLKILRTFNNLNLYLYVHDSFLDLLRLNLRKDASFVRIRRNLVKKIYKKYFSAAAKLKNKRLRLLKRIKKKIVLKFSRKMLFIFLKNKILKKYWSFLKMLLAFHLQKTVPSLCNSKIYILGLSKKNISATVVSEFFFIRLKQYYTIWEVLKNINFLFRPLMRRKIVKGYKIMCSGRFSRKQRTTYNWKSFGSLALSTTKSKLDYSYRSIVLKYSTCTIKVWVRLNKSPKRLVDFVI